MSGTMSIHLEHPLQPPVPTSRPPATRESSSSSSSSFTIVNGRKTYTLSTILDTFQCNIDQEQAWALIYQSTKTLNKLLNDCDSDQKNCPTIQIRLVKLSSFSNILIDCNGDVLPATWISNSVHGDHGCSGSDDNVTMKLKSDDKRLMNESINTLIASLATIIYSALEWNWRQQQQQQQKLYKCDNNVKEPEEEELDLEESLELLMLSMLRGSENKDLVDEGYIDALEESYLQSVLIKCEAHFDDLLCSDKPTKRPNSIIEMLSANSNASAKKVSADLYYRTVCKMLVDEADKLGKLVNQFCDQNSVQKCMHFSARKNSKNCDYHHSPNDSQMDTESLKIWAQTWIKVMSELRFGVRLRPTPVLQITDLDQNPTEKMVSNSAKLKEQIKITKDRLRRASTAPTTTTKTTSSSQPVVANQSITPVITEASIIESLQKLKPASRRTLAPILKPIEPCLHDRLMDEIRQCHYRLRPTTTIIKQASIMELYFREKRALNHRNHHHHHHHHHFEQPNESYLCSSSLYDIGRNLRSSSKKRKMNPDGTFFGHLRPARSISGVLINRHNHHKSPESTIPLVETASPGKSLEKRKRKKTKFYQSCNQSNVNLLFKTSTPELKPSKSCGRIQINSFPIECSELSSFEAGDDDDDDEDFQVNNNQRPPSVSSLERRNSFESLPLVNHGNSLNGPTSFMDSLPSSISISLSPSSNNATSKSLRSLSSNFITISNPYLRRSFNRPNHHHHRDRHNRRPSTHEPSERSFSLLSTTTSTTTTTTTTSTMTPRSKESDNFAKPPPTSTDMIDSLFRYQVLRKSFRSSFNIMFSRLFGSKNVSETDDKLKKE